MSPIKSFISAGDRLDDGMAGGAFGLTLLTPLAQAIGLGDVPDISITSAVVLTVLTLGRMHFGQKKSVEDNRHREAVIRLEIDRILAEANHPSGATKPE